jgi:GTP1/Obg family GTP-binding protein
MGRAKRGSKVVEQAQKRAAGMRSIHAKLDLGNGLTLAEYNQAIDAVQASIDAYNEALSQVDNASNGVQAGEKKTARLVGANADSRCGQVRQR